MKKRIALIALTLALLGTRSLAEIPDVSGLTLDEMIELQGILNAQIAENATYTMLPGIYDCNHDFNYLWYNAIVLPAEDGTIRTATVKICHTTAANPPEYEYTVTSDDEGIRISLLENDKKQWFLILEGAPLEVTPYKGF